jgi:hypothetical protein
MPENADSTRPYRIEAGDQRKQRRLSGAIQPQQDGKRRLSDRQTDIMQCNPRTIAMADAVDLKCGGLSKVEWHYYHSRKSHAHPRQRQADISGPRASCRRAPMKCVMLVIFDAQTFRFDVGDLTYRVACGKLRRPKLDPDY